MYSAKTGHKGLPIVLVAAAAMIDSEGRVLIAQRPEGKSMAGLWEFPGGKVSEGETPEAALVRELEEELNIKTDPVNFQAAAFASHSYPGFHLLMPLFICRTWKGVIEPKEHADFDWVKLDKLHEYPMPEADIPLIDTLKALVK